MPLLLTNEEAMSVLPMEDCLKALEDAYRQEGIGKAAYRAKCNVYITMEPDKPTTFVTQVGGIRNPPVLAINVRSHVPRKSRSFGVFAVFLFSGETGELLAIINNMDIADYRTGGSAGLAGREMARRDAKIVGILGSGGTAIAHALAYACVRKLERFKVYSPNPEHRTAFAQKITKMTGVPAEALDGPEAVVRGSDIVAACTLARGETLIKSEWLDQPGVHMTGVQLGEGGEELDPSGLKLFHRLVTNISEGPATHHNTDPEFKPLRTATSEESLEKFKVIPHHHTLVDVLMGRAPGRESEDERNYFFGEGTGVQYAALAALAYDRARERGIGREASKELAGVLMP